MVRGFYNCGNCNKIYRIDNMTYCCFCKRNVCNDCFKGDPIDEDELKQDDNDYIKLDDYACDSCDKRIQLKADEKRKHEIFKEIMAMVTKKNIDKYKELIKEFESI
jgi:uncharacterized protein YlaI